MSRLGLGLHTDEPLAAGVTAPAWTAGFDDWIDFTATQSSDGFVGLADAGNFTLSHAITTSVCGLITMTLPDITALSANNPRFFSFNDGSNTNRYMCAWVGGGGTDAVISSGGGGLLAIDTFNGAAGEYSIVFVVGNAEQYHKTSSGIRADNGVNYDGTLLTKLGLGGNGFDASANTGQTTHRFGLIYTNQGLTTYNFLLAALAL